MMVKLLSVCRVYVVCCGLRLRLSQDKPQAAYLLPRAVNSVLTDFIAVADQLYMAAGERGHLL